MSIGQVEQFVHQARSAGGIARVKLLGGCPLKSSIFVKAYSILVEAVETGVIESVKIETSHAVPPPAGLRQHPCVRFAGRPVKKKRHLPYLWAPCDLGLATSLGCSHPRHCGFSIDARGYLPCSPAIMIDRLFYGGAHYRHELPADGKVWGMEALCKYCCYAAPADWRTAHVKLLAEFTPEMKRPTASWAAALRAAGVEVAAVYSPGGVPQDEAAVDRVELVE